MAGENARRDKALEDIARELRNTNKLLAHIARSIQPVKFTNHPPDPFDAPQQPQPGEASKNETQPTVEMVVHSTNPYFRRSGMNG